MSDPQPGRKRYALIGTGGRSSFFYSAIATTYKATSQVVAFCDTNQTRLNYANEQLKSMGHAEVPVYAAEDFDRMIQETKPDEVIVTTIDRTHNIYIVRALELGCNVITEKPMTIDAPRCREIFDAVERTGRKVRVTFNYRYAPHNTKVWELIRSGAIGTVTSVHFEWMLNTSHGADYFRRWHRDKRNSGGLLVHKSTHHFDLVNFWLQSQPETVYAQGDLKFYGRENAEKRGVKEFYNRAHGSEGAKSDPFALHMEANAKLKSMYLDAEHEDAYHRDQSVFGDGISIEDTMSVMVRYRNSAVLTYSLTAYAPWEGFRVSFNGTGGRLEMEVIENSYVNSGGDQSLEGSLESRSITLRKLFEKPIDVEIPTSVGAHGGGDEVLLADLFGDKGAEINQDMRAATHVDGAVSILTEPIVDKDTSKHQEKGYGESTGRSRKSGEARRACLLAAWNNHSFYTFFALTAQACVTGRRAMTPTPDAAMQQLAEEYLIENDSSLQAKVKQLADLLQTNGTPSSATTQTARQLLVASDPRLVARARAIAVILSDQGTAQTPPKLKRENSDADNSKGRTQHPKHREAETVITISDTGTDEEQELNHSCQPPSRGRKTTQLIPDADLDEEEELNHSRQPPSRGRKTTQLFPDVDSGEEEELNYPSGRPSRGRKTTQPIPDADSDPAAPEIGNGARAKRLQKSGDARKECLLAA
ncbi:hypothetical protein OPT61_g2998 [Boeremia exigua]|uniref:Uncharacterized protein n=1 Tax=Boeremia exigua TaxID=749465 RepID=A0ACC2IJG5_9PLEO|nr:hypothetical protein OPT61_g2998 [Boeremia exigua]